MRTRRALTFGVKLGLGLGLALCGSCQEDSKDAPSSHGRSGAGGHAGVGGTLYINPPDPMGSAGGDSYGFAAPGYEPCTAPYSGYESCFALQDFITYSAAYLWIDPEALVTADGWRCPSVFETKWTAGRSSEDYCFTNAYCGPRTVQTIATGGEGGIAGENGAAGNGGTDTQYCCYYFANECGA